MSTQYPGGFITKSPVAPTSAAASGIWTVDQALQYVKAGTWPFPPVYVEEVFSTYLYTGTGATQTITNGVNLSNSGGLVWMKSRSASTTHGWYDTARGATFQLSSEFNSAQSTQATGLTAFNSNGFTIGALANLNTSAATYASWTFRKQPKFFDIVTYTGTGVARTISHNLNAAPGFIVVKRTDATADWPCSFVGGGSQYVTLNNGTSVNTSDASVWNDTTASSSTFSVGTSILTNASGGSYVAYLFASSNSGGFGLTGSDSVVASGTENASSGIVNITLGWEPQWILYKWNVGSGGGFTMFDVMRGASVGIATRYLRANAGDEEGGLGGIIFTPNATGFRVDGSGNGITNQQFRYLAIRRGPMKIPTVGTSVFSPIAANVPTGTAQTINFVPDVQLLHYRDGADSVNNTLVDRLRGVSTNATSGGLNLKTSNISAEGASSPGATLFWNNTGFQVSGYLSNVNSLFYSFGRARGFMDLVCYTGTGSTTTFSHNLGVAPELMIVKARSTGVDDWTVYVASLGFTRMLYLNDTFGDMLSSNWGGADPTSSVFSVGAGGRTNTSGTTYVNYMFATLAGVSKVGSYTGTAALQTVNCGFTTGARFVLIKRTDASGAWYVWDSARGISSGTDPYYLVNTNAADVTGTNYVDTDTTGFKVTAAASTTVNISAATYIFLAIA